MRFCCFAYNCPSKWKNEYRIENNLRQTPTRTHKHPHSKETHRDENKYYLIRFEFRFVRVFCFLKIYPVVVWLWEHCQKLNISIFSQYTDFYISFLSNGKAFWWKFIDVFGMLNVCSITDSVSVQLLLRYKFDLFNHSLNSQTAFVFTLFVSFSLHTPGPCPQLWHIPFFWNC